MQFRSVISTSRGLVGASWVLFQTSAGKPMITGQLRKSLCLQVRSRPPFGLFQAAAAAELHGRVTATSFVGVVCVQVEPCVDVQKQKSLAFVTQTAPP